MQYTLRAPEFADKFGEGGVGADVAREDDVAEAGEFRFGAESPDGDAGQGLAEDEGAADAEAEAA